MSVFKGCDAIITIYEVDDTSTPFAISELNNWSIDYTPLVTNFKPLGAYYPHDGVTVGEWSLSLAGYFTPLDFGHDLLTPGQCRYITIETIGAGQDEAYTYSGTVYIDNSNMSGSPDDLIQLSISATGVTTLIGSYANPADAPGFIETLELLGVLDYWLPNEAGTTLVSQNGGTSMLIPDAITTIDIEKSTLSTYDVEYMRNNGQPNTQWRSGGNITIDAPLYNLPNDISYGFFHQQTVQPSGSNVPVMQFGYPTASATSGWGANISKRNADDFNLRMRNLGAGDDTIEYTVKDVDEHLNIFVNDKSTNPGNTIFNSYKDGSLENTFTTLNGVVVPDDKTITVIASTNSYFAIPFIFDRVLTPAEVTQLYESALM